VPSADDVWQATLPTLDALWGVDTSQTIGLLDDFLDRFPDYSPAKDKLYAALVAHADELASAGERVAAAEQLRRAAELLPSRGEAVLALVVLTPTVPPPPPPPASTINPLTGSPTARPGSVDPRSGQPLRPGMPDPQTGLPLGAPPPGTGR
jgi:hypothetical protein